MSGHTPRPWSASDGGNSNYTASITARSIKGKTFTVARLAKPMRGVVSDNARLIAAAPDLLEALQSLTDAVHADLVTSDELAQAAAALAKATGVSP